MHLRRASLAALAVTLAVTTAPALAKARPPAKVCNLLTDIPGDGKSATGGDVIQSPALDVISADVATGAKTLVAVIRVTTTNTASDNMALLGMRWTLNTKINGTDANFAVYRTWGTTDGRTVSVTGAGTAKPVLTIQPNAYVITVDRKAFTALKPGAKIAVQAAASFVGVNNADTATSSRVYVDRQPSCVGAA